MSTTAAKPPLPRVGKLDQESVNAALRRLRANPAVRNEAIRRLRRNPRGVIEDLFDLTREERIALRSAPSRAKAAIVAQVFITALKNPGITVVYRRIQGPPEVNVDLALTAAKKPKAAELKPRDKEEPEVEGKAEIKWHC